MVVWITGAGRGLGLCLVQRCLERGDTVFAGARNTAAPGLAALADQYPGTLHILELDVTSTASCRQAATETARHTDCIDLLINNAAVYEKTAKLPLEETNLDEILPVFDVNSIGPLRVAKVLLPLLRQSADAVIANISSEAGSIAKNWRKAEYGYCMSKAALNRATVILSEALKPDGIRVLAMHPGWLRTDMGGKDAVHDPLQNAEWILAHIARPDAPIFMDFDGSAFPW